MRVLVFTAMYPSPEKPAAGVFIQEQVESLRAVGVEVDVYAFNGNHAALSYVKAARGLRDALARRPYDVLHAHYGLNGVVAVMQRSCPVVITYHGSDLLGVVGAHNRYTLGGKVRTLASQAAAFGAARCIVVADLLKANLWRKSAVTIPMGVDLALFRPLPRREARLRIGYPGDSKQLVLFAAHPQNYGKRFDIAQEAVALLQKGGMDVELLPVYNRPHSEMPWYMNACDALVLTSMHEASPCVIKEALACNLPIAAVDVGDVGVRIGGVQGCHVCQRSPQDVAAKLRLALQGGRSVHGRSRVEDLSLPNIARQVQAVYAQAANKDAQ
jgi:glycosyltransferase involved in cell wall biosynthesis